MKEQHGMKNVKTSRKKRGVGGSVSKLGWVWRKQLWIVRDPQDNRRLHPEGKTTAIEASDDEKCQFIWKGRAWTKKATPKFSCPQQPPR